MAPQTEKVTSGPPRDPRRELGNRGEDLAAAFFIRRGFTVLARNWRCREGELDLVIRRDYEVRVVEVKTRRASGGGYPEDSVSDAKLERIGAAWSAFVLEHPELPDETHLDVLAITLTQAGVPIYHYLPDIE